MKKIFGILLMSILLITLTGCLNSNDNNKRTVSESSNADLNLYSDDTKYVYESDNTTHVFYYEGDTITAYHTYVNYKEEELAKYAYDAVTQDMKEEIDKYYVKGKYLVFEYKESAYSNLELSKLDKTYAYMKKIVKEDLDS